MKRLKTTYAIT